MKPFPKITPPKFDKLFTQYIRQTSKQFHLPKEIEDRLLAQINKPPKF